VGGIHLLFIRDVGCHIVYIGHRIVLELNHRVSAWNGIGARMHRTEEKELNLRARRYVYTYN